jgi:low affinity Fe/Cu permease
VLQGLDTLTSRVSATVVVVVILLGFDVVLAIRGFPNSWQVDFATISNSVVLIFLFSFKHTEHRGLTALQLKLDEVIRAIPAADNHLVQIERAEESEISAREQEKISVHDSLRDGSEDGESD